MVSSIPSALSPQERDHLVHVIKDWAAANGLAIRPPPAITSGVDPEGALAIHAPVTLFPSRFPRKCFDQGISVQRAYNELYARISGDEEFLSGLVNEYVKSVPERAGWRNQYADTLGEDFSTWMSLSRAYGRSTRE